MIATVLLKSLTHYTSKPDRQTHLKNLLNLDVPKLFELPSAGAQTCKWLQMFEDGWKKYIEEKQLQMASQECLSTFLVSNINLVYCVFMHLHAQHVLTAYAIILCSCILLRYCV